MVEASHVPQPVLIPLLRGVFTSSLCFIDATTDIGVAVAAMPWVGQLEVVG